MCVCVLLVTWRANGIVLYMYEGKVLMDTKVQGAIVISSLVTRIANPKLIVVITATNNCYGNEEYWHQ